MEITNGVFVHGMPSMKSTKIIALEETDEDETLRNGRKKRVNAFMVGNERYRSTTTTTIRDRKEVYEADLTLSYDEENPDDEKE